MRGGFRVVTTLLAMLPGCGDGDLGDRGGTPDAGPDAGPDADTFCHYDCFGFQECTDGLVTSWEHTPVPCEYWEGECPHAVTFTCARGCRTDVEELGPSADPREMCEEHRPKQVGDPCTEEAHCRPEVATVSPDGTVVNVYLTCDVDGGSCIAREPPVISDYLQPCGLVAPDPPFTSTTLRIEETAACSSGICIYALDSQNDCVLQGCTAACESDGECPIGTYCDELFSSTGVCVSPDLIEAGMMCL